HWFPDATVNFAEHLLRGEPDATAVIARDEEGNTRTLTYAELRTAVGAAQSRLRELGVQQGDRVAALLPNAADAIVAVIATAGLGAVWSSCSPEFGAQAIVDRFAQLEPKVLVAVESYVYGGKRHDRRAMLDEVRAQLP